MKMKVLQVVSAMDDGGAQTLIKDYAYLLDKDKYEVKIVVIQNIVNSANYKLVSELGITVIPVFRRYNVVSRIARKTIGNKYVPYKLLQIINQENPSIIHIHLPILKYFAPISKYLVGINLFYTCHNLPSIMFYGKHIEEYRAANKLIKENDLTIIALHEEMKNELSKMFCTKRIKVIHNGVDFVRFKQLNEKSHSLRTELGIPENALVIGHIGRFTEQKNHKFLITIFEEVLRRKCDSYLVLIGDGKLKPVIKRNVSELGIDSQVIFLNNRTDIPELLHIMDVFVFPSSYEGLSVTLVEAQTAGVRCIVSDRVNRETILSAETISVSLNSSVDEWIRPILDTSIKNNVFGEISDFNMKNEIKRVESLYLGKKS